MRGLSLILASVLGLGLAPLSGCTATSVTGGPGGDEDLSGGGGVEDLKLAEKPDACVSVRAQASLVKKPVDIIVVVDNSSSMTQEIAAVERNINQNFAAILGTSALDYRVILISRHGLNTSYRICIAAPLSGADSCTPPPAKPVNSARFFHYDVEVASTNSLSLTLSTYTKSDRNNFTTNGWSEWLRPGAFRVFIEMTDDDSAMSVADFEAGLFALTPAAFGTAESRNYVFHTIAGLKQNTPATAPWLPTDPRQTTKCTAGTGAQKAGLVYQDLSILTGGLRFPICEYDSFNAVFQKVAEGVVQGTKVDCAFPIPEGPPGQQIDLKSIVVEYAPGGGGAPQSFKQVANAAACAPASFYIRDDNFRVVLCPDACGAIQKDASAKVQVLFNCKVDIG